jgi:hypothetical protein
MKYRSEIVRNSNLGLLDTEIWMKYKLVKLQFGPVHMPMALLHTQFFWMKYKLMETPV